MSENLNAKGFAPVAPIWLLQKMDALTCGSYHLPLAHDVIQYPQAYSMLFLEMKRMYRDRTVILDNSVIELRDACTPAILKDACEICHPTHLVMPDVLEDGGLTYESTVQANGEMYKWLRQKDIQVAVVPQGRTVQDFVQCASCLAEDMHINLWCVPRNYEQRLGSRYDACEILTRILPRPIHLLGFSNYLWYDMLAAQHPRVIGIDSAVPIRMGQQEEDLLLGTKVPPRGTWWENCQPTEPVTQHTERNLARVRGWLNNN